MPLTEYRSDPVGGNVCFFDTRVEICVFLLIAAVIYDDCRGNIGRVYNVSLSLHTHTVLLSKTIRMYNA